MGKMRKLKKSIVSFMLTLSMLGSVVMSGGPLLVRADTSTSLGTELVQNGTFDTAVDAVTPEGDTVADIGTSGWKAQTTSVMELNYFITDDSVLQIAENEMSTSGVARVRQKVAVTEGTSYTFSAKVKPVGSMTAGSDYVQLQIKDIGGGTVNGSSYNSITFYVGNDDNQLTVNEWNDVTVTFTANSTKNNWIKIHFGGLDKGYWLVDDIDFRVTDSTSNSFTNGDFDGLFGKVATNEKALGSNVFLDDNSKISCGTSSSTDYTPYYFAVVTDATKDSNAVDNLALRVSTAPAAGQISSTLSQNLTAGKTYVLSADVTPTGIVDSSAESPASITFTAGGSVTKTAAEVTEANKKVSAEITVPAGAEDLSTISIAVSSFIDGTWTIDNVSLKEKNTLEKIEPTLSVSAAASEVEQGSTVALTASLVDPDSLTNGDVSWSSNVTEGITITPDTEDSYKATAAVAETVTAGTEVTITATKARNDGKEAISATCIFTVKEKAAIVDLQGISIIEESLKLIVGDTKKPEVTFTPADATNQALTWTSSDNAVATVAADGTITAVGAGEAKITAVAQENTDLVDCVSVSVVEKQIINNGTFDVVTGNKIAIGYTDSNGVSKETIIDEVDSGFSWRPIRSKGDTATDTVLYFEIADGGRTGNAMKIWRNPDNSKSVGAMLQQRNLEGFVEGEKYRLTAYVKNLNANADSYIRLNWTGADGVKKIGAVKLSASECAGEWTPMIYDFPCGIITRKGTLVIDIGDWKNGEWYIDDVSIVQLPAAPYFVMDEKLSVEITNQNAAITWQLVDRDKVLGENPALIWKSYDESVVKVDETGKLTPVDIGTASVTVSSKDGKYSAQCEVTVTEQIVPLTGIALKDSSLALQTGGQQKLEVIFTPDNATYKELTWSSSKEEVAKIAADGTVTAIGSGTAEITVTAKNYPDLTAKCTITVSVSDVLSTSKASYETAYGEPLEGSLTKSITNTTGEKVIYTLYEAPEHGELIVNEDGTFVYTPGIYPLEAREVIYGDKGWEGSGWPEGLKSGLGGSYTFKVLVTAGAESAVLEGTIIEKNLQDTLEALNLTDNHLLFTEESIASVRAAIQVEGSFKQKVWKAFESYLKVIVNSTPPIYEAQGASSNKEGVWQRDVADTTILLLTGYLITGEDAYKDKCMEYALSIANYPFWSESQNYGEGSLTASHNAFAIAMVYDWLKDDMTDEAKQTILNRLYYAGQCLYRERTERMMYMANTHIIMNSALLTVATSLYLDAADAANIIKVDIDDSHEVKNFSGEITVDELKSDCVTWIKWVCGDLGQTIYWLSENDAAYEGYNYFEYGISWMLSALLILEEEFNIDAFTGNKYLENISDFVTYITMPDNYLSNRVFTFDYNDGYRYSYSENVPIMSVLASKYHDTQARYMAEKFLEKGVDNGTSNYWMTLFFGDDVAAASMDTDSTVFYSEQLGYVISRSDWSGNEAILFAKSGLPTGKDTDWVLLNSKSEYHCDPDANSFMLFANGEHLIRTDGRGYKDSKNHSTLFVKGAGDYAIQIGSHAISAKNDDKKDNKSDDFILLNQEPTMTMIESTEAYDYFAGDATEAYYPQAELKKFGRNFVFLKEENVLLIVDDIKTSQNKELQLRWFPESKTVAENYGIYSAYGANTTLNFYPFTTEGVETSFAAIDVTRESMTTEEAFVQNYNGSLWQNAVAFSWAPNGEAQPQVKYQAGNANEHFFEVNGKIYTINVSKNTLTVEEGTLNQPNKWASDSTLSSVLFNGAALEVFDSATTEYDLERFWKTMEVEITPVASAPTAEVSMDWNGECPGTVTITCTSEDKTSTTTYTLKLKNENGMLGIESAVADPNGSGKDVTLTYDNFVAPDAKLKTWSSNNLPVVTYDMGRLVDINKMDVAFNVSSRRNNFYNIYISEDGKKWELIHGDNWNAEMEVEVSIKTKPVEVYNAYQTIYSGETLRTRYVRLALLGNNALDTTVEFGGFVGLNDANKTCSIQEISIYGTEAAPEVMNPEIVVDATDTSYTLGSNEGVTITSTGDFSKFESVAMDDVIVDESNYTVKEGSTIVTFKTEYLETLSEGKHTVTINYTDGSPVTSNLTISKADDSDTGSDVDGDTDADNDDNDSVEVKDAEVTTASSTNTGDSSDMGLWIALMAVCLLGAVTVIIKKTKRIKMR